MSIKLKGKKGLVIGIANDRSIAWGCAQAFYDAGADLAITYLNDKAELHVRPLAEKVNASIIAPLDVTDDTQVTRLIENVRSTWGELDFLLHAIAFAPKEELQGRVTDCSREGFLKAIDISCYSFIRLAHLAESLMKEGGCLLTTTYYGGEKVVNHYGMMGPVKSALDGTVKYLAAELGEKQIRVNALSPGPITTRATGGIGHFDEMLERAKQKSPEHAAVCINCVGSYARFLVSDEARLVTGSTVYIDAGYNVMGA